MLTMKKRAMTAGERGILERAAGAGNGTGFLSKFIIVIGSPVAGMLAAAILGRLLEVFGVSRAALLMLTLIVGPICGFGLGIFYLLNLKNRRRHTIERYDIDLQDGQVEVLECRPRAVVALEEFEDEGPGFFFDLGDGQLLFLQGQYLYDLTEKKKFPSTYFTFVRAPHSRSALSIASQGEVLSPLRTIQLSGSDVLKSVMDFPEDGSVFPGSLESVEQNFLKKD